MYKFNYKKERITYMATIIPHKNKVGEIISYQIQVYKGRDINGIKLKP